MSDWGRLVCINKRCFTGGDVTHGRKSAVDTLVSDSLAGKSEWRVGTVGRDHYPIWCKIAVDLSKPGWRDFQDGKLMQNCVITICVKLYDIEDVEELSKNISVKKYGRGSNREEENYK